MLGRCFPRRGGLTRRIDALLVSWVLFFISGPLGATGFEFADIGQLALGRGFAYVARADGPEAFHYNPAGLAKLRGLSVQLGGTFVGARLAFDRRGSGYICRADTYACLYPLGEGEDVYDPARDQGPYALDPLGDVNKGGAPYKTAKMDRMNPLPLPLLSVNYGGLFGVDGLAVGVGVTSPSSFGSLRFSADGAQRYTLIESDIKAVLFGVGLAYGPSRYFRVGAVFNAAFLDARLSQATQTVASPRRAGQNELLEDDVHVRVSVTDPMTPTGTFGVISQPFDLLELGAALRLPVGFRARGRASITPSESSPDLKLVGDGRVVLEHRLPLVARFGARFVQPRFDVEVNYIFERTGQISKTPLIMKDVVVDNGLGDLITFHDVDIPFRFRDAHGVRVGGDVVVLPGRLSLRGGAFYAGTAYPDNHETFSVLFPYARQVGLTAGFSVWLWRDQREPSRAFIVHAGYGHIFQQSVTVTHGVAQQNVVRDAPDDPSAGNIVNNGRYDAGFDLFGLTIEARL